MPDVDLAKKVVRHILDGLLQYSCITNMKTHKEIGITSQNLAGSKHK